MQKQLMGMITSPASWEQVIYDVIAWEGLDPWDIDLKRLADGFLGYVKSMEQMDFKIPAKYLMVASTLLRMKSDHLPLLDYFHEDDAFEADENGTRERLEEPALNPLTIPPRRVPERRIVVSELVAALRKVMGSADRRTVRQEKAQSLIKIRHDDIAQRISGLYERINALLGRVEKKEVTFTELVPEKTKQGVSETFLPLVYLDQQKRVACRQEEMFDEIFVSRGEKREAAGVPVKKAPLKKKRRKRGPQKNR